jgi:hypothetical protein
MVFPERQNGERGTVSTASILRARFGHKHW